MVNSPFLVVLSEGEKLSMRQRIVYSSEIQILNESTKSNSILFLRIIEMIEEM
jgi:hypothetical protein